MAGLVPFNRKNKLIGPSFEDFYGMLDDFFSDDIVPRRSLIRDTFKLDVEEKDKEYVIEAELPGVKKEEVSLEINEGHLKISIKREEIIDEEKRNFVHKERRYSSMTRSIYLKDAKSEDIKAILDNGVLNITVPKKESDKVMTNKIEIE